MPLLPLPNCQRSDPHSFPLPSDRFPLQVFPGFPTAPASWHRRKTKAQPLGRSSPWTEEEPVTVSFRPQLKLLQATHHRRGQHTSHTGSHRISPCRPRPPWASTTKPRTPSTTLGLAFIAADTPQPRRGDSVATSIRGSGTHRTRGSVLAREEYYRGCFGASTPPLRNCEILGESPQRPPSHDC